MLTVLLSLKDWTNGHEISLFARAMYSSLSKPAWGLGLSWIVISCYYGYGGNINFFAKSIFRYNQRIYVLEHMGSTWTFIIWYIFSPYSSVNIHVWDAKIANFVFDLYRMGRTKNDI